MSTISSSTGRSFGGLFFVPVVICALIVLIMLANFDSLVLLTPAQDGEEDSMNDPDSPPPGNPKFQQGPWPIPPGLPEDVRRNLERFNWTIQELDDIFIVQGKHPETGKLIAEHVFYRSSSPEMVGDVLYAALEKLGLAGQSVIQSNLFVFEMNNRGLGTALWKATELFTQQNNPGSLRVVWDMSNPAGWTSRHIMAIFDSLISQGYKIEILWSGYDGVNGWLWRAIPPAGVVGAITHYFFTSASPDEITP